jgi:hypothetical protein
MAFGIDDAAALGGAAISTIGSLFGGKKGPPQVQLEYAKDAQNMMMPLAMQGISGWGSQVPSQYVASSADFAKRFSRNFGSGFGGGSEIDTTGAGDSTMGQQGQVQAPQFFGSGFNPRAYAGQAYDARYASAMPTRNQEIDISNDAYGAMMPVYGAPSPYAGSGQMGIQPKFSTTKPRFGTGGGNLGSYTGGWGGKV